MSTTSDSNESATTEESTRTRTRTRSRDEGGSAKAGSSAGDDAPAKGSRTKKDDGSGDDAPSTRSSGGGSSEGDDDGSSRRRRRGGRGRGRGRKGSGGGSGSGGGGEAKDGGSSAKDADGKGEEQDSGKGGGAIAKGGTRMAAKKGRGRRGGGRGRGGRRDDSRTGGVPEEVRRAIVEGPPRTMLVTSSEERTQIAVLEDRTLVEHYVTRADERSYVGNIYMARVQNVLPGMEAAFLDIGKGRNGVLYAGEVLYDEADVEDANSPRIEEALKQGNKVLVQVTKDPMGTKGARLTQHLSLAGRYMVLAPNSDVFGISRKLTDDERDRLRKILKKIKPSEHGVIVRTAAEGAPEEAITADLERLLKKWEKVEADAKDAKALDAVYEEPSLVVKVIRDHFGPEFVECVVDDEELYGQVRDYLEEVAPDLLDKVKLYAPEVEEGETADPIFEAYHVGEQLRKAVDRKVWLPSGGYLIIEKTEAMTIVDVNTGKFTGKSSLEETVLKTNLEAAEEVVRQLRLRDIGGIIIVDFIDMLLKANQDQVVRRLKRELLRDRTKTRVSEVSRLGLVQMTRKNVSQGLVESFSHKCDECNGHGYIVNGL